MNLSRQSHLNQFLTNENLGEIKAVYPVSGGSINEAFKLETASGPFFLKVNSAGRFPGMFEFERKGLQLLTASDFIVPKPIATATIEEDQFILMEWLEKGSPKPDFWNEFGRSLAQLHSMSDSHFGLGHNNYIGSLPQRNSKKGTWVDFYREERLLPQMRLAEQRGRMTIKMKRGFDALFNTLERIFPVEKPSLIHGDLWSGNMMVSSNGSSSIFDPAVYFGHREMDLAMMALFGGFGDTWIDAYNEVYPLESGRKERVPIGQLYPLMVHVNLFGGGYGNDVERILQRFT